MKLRFFISNYICKVKHFQISYLIFANILTRTHSAVISSTMSSFDETTKIWKGPKTPYPYPTNVHISEIILKSLIKTPNRVLQIYDENGAQLTCDELRLKAIRVAQHLTKLGIKQGDVVGFDCSNSENILALLNGCVFIGAILSSMSLAHDTSDIIHMWSQTEPKFVFCDAEVYEKVVAALSSMNSHATVCTLIERKHGVMFVDDVLATTGMEENFEPVKCINSEDSLIAFVSSSGTTGPPKAVCLAQSAFLRFADVAQGLEVRFINFGPFFWVVPLLLFISLPLTNMTRVVTRRLISVENTFELVKKFNVDFLFTVPVVLNKILQEPSSETEDLSSLKIIASVGAILHPDLRIKFKQIFPQKQLINFYGSSEIIFTWPLLSDENDGYIVGRPSANTEVKIVDDDGNNLGIGERGEICAKSNFPFAGYHKRPEDSKAAVDDDNFIKTGDVGYFDQLGIMSVVDRKKDIFKYYLYHINPTEIENVIQSLDGVELVSVVGIPTEETNMTCAVVVKRKGYDHLTKEDVIAYVADRLPVYKQLHGGVAFVEKLPTTPSGKIIKRLVTELAEEEFKKLKSNE